VSRVFSYAVMNLLVVSLWLMAFGCTNTLSSQDYIRWVRDYDNGLHVRKEANVFVFDVQYQPIEYLKLSSQNNSIVSEQSDSLQYYILRIGMKQGDDDIISYQVQNMSEKQQRLYYYSYLFQNNIYLEDNEVKLPCVLFHFEQSDLESARTFVLGFPKSFSDEPSLVIDSRFFGSLPIKIKIDRHNIPTVRL
jgi:hypothetical protein